MCRRLCLTEQVYEVMLARYHRQAIAAAKLRADLSKRHGERARMEAEMGLPLAPDEDVTPEEEAERMVG